MSDDRAVKRRGEERTPTSWKKKKKRVESRETRKEYGIGGKGGSSLAPERGESLDKGGEGLEKNIGEKPACKGLATIWGDDGKGRGVSSLKEICISRKKNARSSGKTRFPDLYRRKGT